MNPFRVFQQDVRHFRKKPMLIATFAAIALIPMLYSGILIKGTWDPYGRLTDLPVALVNLDRGADFGGTYKNVGRQFVSELAKNPAFRWSFVDVQEAGRGMLDNRYYAAITIPASFSADAASLASDHPRQAEIVYESNSYYNFVAGQISENATKELRTKLSQNLTEAYTRSIAGQFSSLSAGLSAAGDGAAKLKAGSLRLKDGIIDVQTHLGELAGGAARVNDGIGRLAAGAAEAGAGSSEVSDGAAGLANGLQRLSAAGGQLRRGAADAERGAAALAAGLRESASGSRQLETGLAASESASGDLAGAAVQVAEGLRKLTDANADLAGNPQVQQLLAASREVAQGAKELNAAQKRLLAGSRSLSESRQRLLEGASKLKQGQGKMVQGLNGYNANVDAAASGGAKLAQGAARLRQGVGRLQAGLTQLAAGSGELADGTSRLQAGMAPLAAGAADLANGSGELAAKLGAAAGQTAALKADDRTMRLFAQPVAIRANDDRHIKLYGYGIAPYFISISLFAGALVFTTVFSPRNSSVAGSAGIPLFFSKLLTFGFMSLAQSLILCTVLVYALGLRVQSVPLLYAFTAVAGFAFMFIVQAFVTWLDQPGRFLVLVLMILQLASSAGTFPLELLPDWAKALNPWLPMTYSIRGLREVISSGDYADMRLQMFRLAVYIVLFLAVTFLYFMRRKEGKTREQLMPARV